MPASGTPAAGSYSQPQTSQTYFFIMRVGFRGLYKWLIKMWGNPYCVECLGRRWDVSGARRKGRYMRRQRSGGCCCRSGQRMRNCGCCHCRSGRLRKSGGCCWQADSPGCPRTDCLPVRDVRFVRCPDGCCPVQDAFPGCSPADGLDRDGSPCFQVFPACRSYGSCLRGAGADGVR